MTQHILTLNNYLMNPINGFLNLLKDFRQAMEDRNRINDTVKELRKLSDRELNDIGINRGDIYSIARMDVDMKVRG
jgi:uncharacterized protein YjiS (DUF1127 family)